MIAMTIMITAIPKIHHHFGRFSAEIAAFQVVFGIYTAFIADAAFFFCFFFGFSFGAEKRVG